MYVTDLSRVEYFGKYIGLEEPLAVMTDFCATPCIYELDQMINLCRQKFRHIFFP